MASIPCFSHASASATHSGQETPSWPSTINAMRSGLASERSREGPELAFGVVGVVAPVAVLLVGRLHDDLGPRGLGARKVRVDVVDVHVDEAAPVVSLLRASVVLAGVTEHHGVLAEAEFRVVDASLVVSHAHRLLEAEGVRQELDRGGGVLVEQVWGNGTHGESVGLGTAQPYRCEPFLVPGRSRFRVPTRRRLRRHSSTSRYSSIGTQRSRT